MTTCGFTQMRHIFCSIAQFCCCFTANTRSLRTLMSILRSLALSLASRILMSNTLSNSYGLSYFCRNFCVESRALLGTTKFGRAAGTPYTPDFCAKTTSLHDFSYFYSSPRAFFSQDYFSGHSFNTVFFPPCTYVVVFCPGGSTPQRTILHVPCMFLLKSARSLALLL